MEEKRADEIKQVFSVVAARYDLLNTVISMGMHPHMRRGCIALIKPSGCEKALDLCTGTGDFAFLMSKYAKEVTAIDFSEEMIACAKAKAAKKQCDNVTFQVADALELPFCDNTFDIVTIGFGVRNLVDISKGVAEISRLLKPGGTVCCLDINHVKSPIFGPLWNIYFYKMMPVISRVFGGKGYAYDYLASSVQSFLSAEELADKFCEAGFCEINIVKKIFGGVCIHTGKKPEQDI